jgi:hypothetical protein
VNKKEELSKGEILAIFGIQILNGRATTKQLTDILKLSERYIRNLTVLLRRKKYITSLGASEIRIGIRFGSPVSSISEVEIGPKEKVHILTIDFQELLEKHPEILEWAKSTFKISSKKELEEYLEKIRKEILTKKEG